jgi:exodeoxyribonuclease V gamma subunit
MSGFNLFTGNKLEILAERLAEKILAPLSDPLQSEIVVVQNGGMQRWVSMQLAAHTGVCANVLFPFPRAFLYEIASRLGHISISDEYEPEFLAWRIMELLPDCLNDPVYGGINNYLAEDHNGLKPYQLCAKIASTFDRYLVYRPEMIAAWEKGDRGVAEEVWQADLWRKIRRLSPAEHLVGIYKIIVDKLEGNDSNSSLPERIAVFGISSLPPLYLHLFQELSKFTEVNGFFLNPSREFWMDIRSEREIGKTLERVRERSSLKNATREDLYFHRGNGLLSSLGGTGRDFYARLLEFSASLYEEFSDPDKNTLLGIVQSDILNLKDRGAEENPQKIVSVDDRSIRINSCHNMLREIEVLYDQLLEMFAENPDLLPKDVVVMAPEIEKYAPYIEAVFGVRFLPSNPKDRSQEIRYSIADYSIGRGSSIFQAMTGILELLQGRFVLSDFISLLDYKPIRKRFELDENDVEAIRRWVVESGIRWGIDAEDRSSKGLPATLENTWRMGLDRMLLGYSIPEEGLRMFSGIVPYGDIEGKDGEMLGRFVTLVEVIISLSKSLSERRTLKEWASYFLFIAGELLEPSAEQNEQDDVRLLRERLEQMRRIEEKAGFSGTVEFFVAKSLLEKYLKETKRSYGYMTGGVTFCSLLPMRSIPCRVVCVIGMNNADYPRHFEDVNFDLIGQTPQQGDPSQKDEDRYLFLEALLSARQFLYISYVGLSSEDNSVIPPSVVVSELLDYLAEGFFATEGTLRDQLLVSHHLQAFHPSYFSENKKPLSYCRHNCKAAKKLSESSPVKRVFFQDPLPEQGDDLREIGIADLKSFFGNPSKYLLKRRIGLSFDRNYETPTDKEAFRIYGLAGYEIGEEMLKCSLGGGDLKELFNVMMASGKLPHGTAGLSGYQTLSSEISAFAVLLKKELGDITTRHVDLDISVGGFHIAGRIHDLSESGILKYRFGRIRAKDHIGIWIDLLLLGAAGKGAATTPSFIIGRKERWKYLQPQKALDILAGLLELYSEGTRKPLFLFPETSLCYVEHLMKGASENEALRQAEKKWRGDSYANGANGEADDPYFRQCFSYEPDFDDIFRKTAWAFFNPLLSCRDKYK